MMEAVVTAAGILSGFILGLLLGRWLGGRRSAERLGVVEAERQALAEQVASQEQSLADAHRALGEANGALDLARNSLEEAGKLMEGQSYKDPLTGLANRRHVGLVLGDDVAGVIRTYRDAKSTQPIPNADLVFLLVDLDRFTDLNERFGNIVGDQVLAATAQILRRVVREGDLVARWSGAAFLVVARRASRAEGALLAERMRAAVAQERLSVEGLPEPLHWTISIGFSAMPFKPAEPEWMGWERLVAVADACLFGAKKAGRNGWVGVFPKPEFDRVKHGGKLPNFMAELVKAGVVDIASSRSDPFGAFHGQVFG